MIVKRIKAKEEYKKQLCISSIKTAHFVISLLLFFLIWLIFRYGGLNMLRSYGFRYNYFILAGYGALLLFFYRTYNAFLFGFSRIRELAFSQAVSQCFSVAVIYFLVSIGWNKWHSPKYFLILLIIQLPIDLLFSFFGNGLFYKLYPPKRSILIYGRTVDRKRLEILNRQPTDRLYQVTEEIHYQGEPFEDIRPKLENYEAVFVAGIESRCRNGVAKYCKEKEIDGFFLPHVGDVIMQEAKHIQSFEAPVLFVTRSSLNPEYRIIKRIFDVVASMSGIVLLSPLLLLTAYAVHAFDGGPAIYHQTRLTKDGKEFQILKFRSMRTDAENDGIARLSSGEADPRITPIGRFIRKCRLDELPQLFNILLGDMSFVGPRPERPEIAEQYCAQMPDFHLRLQVKAGLTGYAQVYGKYNTDPYEKLEFDLLYINNMNVLTDLQLMFATFSILFHRESTEGVEEGMTTAMEQNLQPQNEKGSQT